MISKKVDLAKIKESEKFNSSTYSTRYFSEDVPKFEIPEDGMPAEAAYQLVHDELNLDGNPSLNLASFVTTWMEPEARKVIDENLHKNFIDHDEYPQTGIIQDRVVNMLARMFNAPDECDSVGTSTIGSSEAIMLGLLAHKWTWRKRREAAGKPADKPNLVMGADVHTVWEKFARYFDVEPRIIPMEEGRYTITAGEVKKRIDENTICVGAVVGTTFTGQMDPINRINDLLIDVKKNEGLDIPIHVDGASGAFFVPFIFPERECDFRLEQVKSINVSGHKYGLVYPGVGWLVFRNKEDLPDDLVFQVNYLGGSMPTFTLNFSKGSSMVLAQYYNLLRLGKSGYKNVMENIRDNAIYLAKVLEGSGKCEVLGEKHALPVMALKLKGDPPFTVFDVSAKLKERGWIIPAYTLPPNAEHIAVLRIVVRENFSKDMAEMLVDDLRKGWKELEQSTARAQTKDIGGKPIC